VWLSVLLWTGVIFTFSSRPSLHSEFGLTLDVILRKIAHVMEFLILGFLLVRALGHGQPTSSRQAALAITLALLYAASDEFHQTFVPGRTGLPTDVVIDAIGVIAGVWLATKNQQRKTATG